LRRQLQNAPARPLLPHFSETLDGTPTKPNSNYRRLPRIYGDGRKQRARIFARRGDGPAEADRHDLGIVFNALPEHRRAPTVIEQLANALIACVATAPNPFMTYADFGIQFGFNHRHPPAWANRRNLALVARRLLDDPNINIDLTILLRSRKAGYPTVIDGELYQIGNIKQQARAREIADTIIKKYGLTVRNPY
jgi:hypothetical protein